MYPYKEYLTQVSKLVESRTGYKEKFSYMYIGRYANAAYKKIMKKTSLQVFSLWFLCQHCGNYAFKNKTF